MPTLPLYLPWNPNEPMDTWRQVRIPGGFEYWRFCITANDGVIELIFSLALHTSPAYRRRYRQWKRRPTHHRPPVSMEEPAVGLHLLRTGQADVSIWDPSDPGSFQAESDGTVIRIAKSSLSFHADGTAHIVLDHPRIYGTGTFQPVPEGAGTLPSTETGLWIAARRPYTASIRITSPAGQFAELNLQGATDYEHGLGSTQPVNFRRHDVA